MKNYLFALVLLLQSLAAYCQPPIVIDTPTITEPILIDTTQLIEEDVVMDTISPYAAPVVVDTPTIAQPSIVRAEPPTEPKPINLNMKKGRINVRAGGYYLAGGLPAMGIGAAMVALSHTIQVKEPQLLKVAGYGFISIGGVFSITGLGHIIHGKRLMRR